MHARCASCEETGLGETIRNWAVNIAGRSHGIGWAADSPRITSLTTVPSPSTADREPWHHRKNVLLQENGCRILRSLAEDTGKRLDDVLDAILRALVHRSTIPRIDAF